MRIVTRLVRPWLLGGFAALSVLSAACGAESDDEAVQVPEAVPPTVSEVPPTSSDGDEEATRSAVEVDATIEDDVVAEESFDDLADGHRAEARVDLAPVEGEAVSYADHIQPILERSCVSCHGPEQAGSDHVVLATAADAVRQADGITTYADARLMPPWPASPLSLPFEGDVTLTDGEIAAIAEWVDRGAELDVDPTTPLMPATRSSYLDDPEIVMTSAGGPYAGDFGAVDDYRCLVFEPGNTQSEWILGSHFVPDVTEVVHHAIITLASAELRDQAAWLDDLAPGPGWTCYGGTGLQTNEGGTLRRLGGWAPGGQPARLPEGHAVPLEPGDFVVVQIHYHYDGPAPADLSQFQIDLAGEEEIAAVGGEFSELTGALYLGPAEIPCYEGDTDPLCDRDAAIERVRGLYGDFIAGLPDYFIWNCGVSVDDFAEMTNGEAWSTCDLPVQNPGRITSVTGHMHELGSRIRLTLNPGEDDETILLDIPDWDFEWQLGYRPVDDIIIDSDDTIRVECAWDRENAPYEAVGYILWSDGTGDEMCYSAISTAPVG